MKMGWLTNMTVPISNPYIPQIVYGFGASFQYKVGLLCILQGAGKVSIYLDDIHPFDIYHKNVLKFVADDCWSASIPILMRSIRDWRTM